MRALLFLLLLAAGLAGCAEEGAAPEEQTSEDFDDVEVTVTDTTGAIRGVVVNDAIVPVAEATIELGQGDATTKTDAQGRFSFSDLDPGTYFLTITKPVHEPAQTSVVVEAGVEEPPIVKVQLNRLFTETPYMETVNYRGFVGCAYNMFISSTCVNDYTRIDPTGTCNGGCAPFVTGVVDQREYQSEVGRGWQTIIWEMAWESSAAGTAEEMQITVSFKERQGASHWYTSKSSPQPFRLQCDVDTICPEQQDGADGEPMIDPEGQDNLWNMISAGDSNVALQQDIEIFQSNFYFAPPPEGWSFIAGDDNPF